MSLLWLHLSADITTQYTLKKHCNEWYLPNTELSRSYYTTHWNANYNVALRRHCPKNKYYNLLQMFSRDRTTKFFWNFPRKKKTVTTAYQWNPLQIKMEKGEKWSNQTGETWTSEAEKIYNSFYYFAHCCVFRHGFREQNLRRKCSFVNVLNFRKPVFSKSD